MTVSRVLSAILSMVHAGGSHVAREPEECLVADTGLGSAHAGVRSADWRECPGGSSEVRQSVTPDLSGQSPSRSDEVALRLDGENIYLLPRRRRVRRIALGQYARGGIFEKTLAGCRWHGAVGFCSDRLHDRRRRWRRRIRMGLEIQTKGRRPARKAENDSVATAAHLSNIALIRAGFEHCRPCRRARWSGSEVIQARHTPDNFAGRYAGSDRAQGTANWHHPSGECDRPRSNWNSSHRRYPPEFALGFGFARQGARSFSGARIRPDGSDRAVSRRRACGTRRGREFSGAISERPRCAPRFALRRRDFVARPNQNKMDRGIRSSRARDLLGSLGCRAYRLHSANSS